MEALPPLAPARRCTDSDTFRMNSLLAAVCRSTSVAHRARDRIRERLRQMDPPCRRLNADSRCGIHGPTRSSRPYLDEVTLPVVAQTVLEDFANLRL
jgi:hypothetical protein